MKKIVAKVNGKMETIIHAMQFMIGAYIVLFEIDHNFFQIVLLV